MAIKIDQFFAPWIAANFALFPPVVFFWAFMFGWGMFFEIDYRLMFILSFVDYLTYFIVFGVMLFIAVLAAIGFGLPLWQRINASRPLSWIDAREQQAMRALRYLMFVAMAGGGLIGGLLGIFVGIFTGIIVFFLFAIPAVSSYKSGDIGRFRGAVVICVIALSWMTMEVGRLAGYRLSTGPKRVYFIKLQDKVDVYANIVMYTSNGVIYKASGEVYFSPNDAIIFTRRTGFRKQM